MDTVFFGSFSKTMFMDLYNLNIGSYHKNILIIECKEYPILYHNYMDLKQLKRNDQGAFILCLASCKDEVISLNHGSIILSDTYHNFPIDDCIEKHKEGIYVSYKSGKITIVLPKIRYFYMDNFTSISLTPFDNSLELKAEDYKIIDLEENNA